MGGADKRPSDTIPIYIDVFDDEQSISLSALWNKANEAIVILRGLAQERRVLMSRELNLQPEEAVCFVVLLGFIKVFLVNISFYKTQMTILGLGADLHNEDDER